MSPPPPRARDLPLVALSTAVLLLAGFVVAASVLDPTERFDGWDAIWNARALSSWQGYTDTRPPLLAALLWPADAWMRARGPRVDTLVPYRLTTAALHVLFLVVTAVWLRRSFPRGWAPVLGFVAAVPTFLFFTQAHRVSHDLFPGALLVGMLALLERVHQRPRAGPLTGLILLGAAAALFKEPFGVFWPALLVGYLAAYPRHRRTLAALGAAAGASALLYWLVFSAVLGAWGPEVPFAQRVWLHLTSRLSQYEGTGATFPAWVYAWNADAWGAALLLAAPGAVLAWRRGGADRAVVLVALTCVAALHAVSQREVRYLLFLAPLWAHLGAVLVQAAWHRPAARLAVLAVVALGVVPGLREASAVLSAAAQDGPQQCFFRPLVERARAATGVAQLRLLSFRSRADNDLPGDRYFGLDHLAARHSALLLGRGVLELPGDAAPSLHRRALEQPGWLLLVASEVLINDVAATHPAPPLGLPHFWMAGAVSEVLPRRAEELSFSVVDGVLRVTATPALPALLFPAVEIDGAVHAATAAPDGSWAVADTPLPGPGAVVRLAGFRVFSDDDGTRCLAR